MPDRRYAPAGRRAPTVVDGNRARSPAPRWASRASGRPAAALWTVSVDHPPKSGIAFRNRPGASRWAQRTYSVSRPRVRPTAATTPAVRPRLRRRNVAWTNAHAPRECLRDPSRGPHGRRLFCTYGLSLGWSPVHVYPVDFFEDKQYSIDPKLCFIIMPFGAIWSDRIYKTIEEIVSGTGFKCIRADMSYGRVVLSDVWEQINRSAFLIADLTGANPNVYYELGIAHCLGKEIIPLLQRGEDIPFDQRPFRILFYEDNRDGYHILERELPRWIGSFSYTSSPHLLLKNEQVAAFNEWRKTRAVRPRVNLTSDDFSDLVLESLDLHDVQASESSFRGSILDDANLQGAVFLSHARLRRCNLHQANLSESDLSMTDLTGADLTQSILLRVRLQGALFSGADVSGLTIDRATFLKHQGTFDDVDNRDQLVVEA